jgi:predicted DCC family thiol-disulfide oxidoreductase YuxK
LSRAKTKLPKLALTVLYDGGCPLCSREIAWHRRRQGTGPTQWLDVSQRDCPLPDHLSRQAVLARFHVLRSDGKTFSGAGAFVELWSQTPGLGWVARWARRLHLVPLLEWGYQRFLPLRGRLVRTLFRSPS